jgi:hypothetical protein
LIDETLFPFAVAVRDFTGIKLIDGGDTVDVRFTAADGRMIAVLIPRAAFADLRASRLEPPAPLDGLERLEQT